MADPIKLSSLKKQSTPKPPPTPSRAPTYFPDIFGVVRIVDEEPTWTPRGRLEDSLALLIDDGTLRVCVYDYSNARWLFAALSTSSTKLGFFGTTPVTQRTADTVNAQTNEFSTEFFADNTYGNNEKNMLNIIFQSLIAYGLIRETP
jgi:hypothetical protein